MRKTLFKSLFLLSVLLIVPNFANAEISFTNGKWSTTFNYGPCTQRGFGGGPDCATVSGLFSPDGIYFNWGAVSVNGKYTEVTSGANNPSGAGGNGYRSWVGDGSNINTGTTKVEFPGYQKEVWVRWYERYQAGFKWSSLVYSKELYFNSGTPSVSAIVAFHGGGYTVGAQGTPDAYQVDSNYGWNSIMGGSVSDGKFHCYEVHLKMDTNGTDGIGRIWIDGVLRAENTHVNWSNNLSASKSGWREFEIKSNQSSPVNGQVVYVDFDDIVVYNTTPPNRDASGKAFIGPLGSTGGGTTPTDTTPPSVPSPTATAVSSSQINLSWTASTDSVGVTGYKIYRNGTYPLPQQPPLRTTTPVSPQPPHTATEALLSMQQGMNLVNLQQRV